MARPREFDKDEALYKAMLVFWKNGYDGTSIPDLLDATGISRSSLYETFVDKQTLFLGAMNRYRQFIGKSGIQILVDYLSGSAASGKPGLPVLREYFTGRIDMALDPRYPGGCFVTNVATSLESADDKVRAAVLGHIAKTEEIFRAVIDRCKENGEIPESRDSQALTVYLLGIASGINVLARVGRDRVALERIMDTALESLK